MTSLSGSRQGPSEETQRMDPSRVHHPFESQTLRRRGTLWRKGTPGHGSSVVHTWLGPPSKGAQDGESTRAFDEPTESESLKIERE